MAKNEIANSKWSNEELGLFAMSKEKYKNA